MSNFEEDMLIAESRKNHTGDKKPTYMSIEERFMVRDYIILPHMLTMADNSHRAILATTNPLKSVIARFLQVLMDRISREMQATVREFGKRKIKVIQDNFKDDIYYYNVVCRGFTENVGYTREVMRTEIRNKITEFTEEVLKQTEAKSN